MPTDPRDPEDIRNEAAKLSADGGSEPSVANSDEKHPFAFSFRKGLEHGLNGLLADPSDFVEFAKGTEDPDPTTFDKVEPFRGHFFTDAANALPAEHNFREWESPTAGWAFSLEGPDAQAIPMPKAPSIGSAEFAAEAAEVYQMALSRDWGVAAFMDDTLIEDLRIADGTRLAKAKKDMIKATNRLVDNAATRLSHLRWFKGEQNGADIGDPLKKSRRRFGERQTAKTLFRGKGEDAWATPFVSQFMVMGSGGGDRDPKLRASGRVAFGAQTIDQSVKIAIPGKDYMTRWLDYLDVQNGANIRKGHKFSDDEIIVGKTRPISTLRDMATYVHDDALYQAYQIAALILLDEGFATDPGIPYHKNAASDLSNANQEPFALFGGPHLLDLVASVSSPALKAVRYQKFTVHRRLRPEAAGALFHTVLSEYEPHRDLKGEPAFAGQVAPYALGDGTDEAITRKRLGSTVAPYLDGPGESMVGSEPALEAILSDIRLHNAAQNGEDPADLNKSKWLLPMAFIEGSPMHPAYGAGHATVAGACVTLLKAFFAMTETDNAGNMHPVYLVKPGDTALVPEAPMSLKDTGSDMLGVPIPQGLTLESELNKLIWNVSNARNIAGVHYYTDYIESALLGEAITIGILREQMLTYHPNETVSMTVPLIVPRKLPKALLNGSSLTEHDIVSKVLIQSNGTLARLA